MKQMSSMVRNVLSYSSTSHVPKTTWRDFPHNAHANPHYTFIICTRISFLKEQQRSFHKSINFRRNNRSSFHVLHICQFKFNDFQCQRLWQQKKVKVTKYIFYQITNFTYFIAVQIGCKIFSFSLPWNTTRFVLFCLCIFFFIQNLNQHCT